VNSTSPGRSQTPRFPDPPEALKRVPLIERQGIAWINGTIAAPTESTPPTWWKAALAISMTLTLLFVAMIAYMTSTGAGVWGINHPVMWGWAIINFVWWIGIGHAGTLISAILFLCRQRWRTSINRIAEIMTIFAVLCAALFPLIHLGRAWFSWWLLPIPTSNSVWPQFRSPLVWDVFAVGTYFTVSAFLLPWLNPRPGCITRSGKRPPC
jgi:molybdopterin-containing oxidoreductase family membrane subunit